MLNQLLSFPHIRLFIFWVIYRSSYAVSQPASLVISPSNSTASTVLTCPPAETFIQTHMAPDFETPQLVRRLDWFHDDSIIASYQQDVITDAARQWWVAHGRYELIRPFYSLRINGIKPEDSGTYRCRLETDPLFSLTMSTAYIEVTVLVRPVPPSSPTIKEYTNHSVTLTWTHQTARAHRPIKRFSVAVRSMPDDTRYIIAAPSNSTSVIVDNLSAYTLYGFAVRAENAAGNSDFGPETTFRTLGEAPKTPPIIESIKNATVGGCITVHVRPPPDMHGELSGYVIYTTRLNDTEPRKQFFTSPLSSSLNICGLHSDSAYNLSIEAENGFGISPQITRQFETETSVPNWIPTNIVLRPAFEKPEISVEWSVPDSTNTVIERYNIYYKKSSDVKWKLKTIDASKAKFTTYHDRLANLDPDSEYKVRLSASSARGEGKRSVDLITTTDYAVPIPPDIRSISFDCKPQAVYLKWNVPDYYNQTIFIVELSNSSRTQNYKTNKTEITIRNLALNSEYLVKTFSALRSRVDNAQLIKSPSGAMHKLILQGECEYQTSLCTSKDPHHKCLQLNQQPSFHRLAYITIVFAFILFVFIVILIAKMAKNRSVDLKQLLKKKEKCVYLEEVSPLVYDSVGFDDIPVELFYGVCEDLSRNNAAKYKSQFEQIEKMSSLEIEDCIQGDDIHLDKNRYLNIGAIEATRIRINSSTGSDYINANYIDSTLKRRVYIATQAPLPSTFADFWCMIWQERCNVVVMITNLVEDGRRKCDQYWPSVIDAPQTHGIYQISLLSETSNAHFSHRIFSLKITKCVPPTERRIHQLHFVGWPDHGIPTSVFPLLNFINYMSDIHTTGSIVVHCSAGVGRTGCMILIDSMRRHLVENRSLNLAAHLIRMRKQREKLVQTVDQYVFCHEAVRQLIRHGITRIHSDLYMRYLSYLTEENSNGKQRMQMQYEDICACHHTPSCSSTPDCVVLPGYHRLDEFIVLNSTGEDEDLWRLVWQRNCQTVVLLRSSHAPNEIQFWRGISIVDNMTLQRGDNFVLLQNHEDQLCVRILNVTKSGLETEFWQEVEKIQKYRLAYHDAPLLIINLITCSLASSNVTTMPIHSPFDSSNSPHSSTLSVSLTSDPSPSLPYALCALTNLGCQLEHEGCVDVVHVLAAYQQMRCGLWSSKNDIEFIYEKLTLLIGGTRV